MTKKDKIVEFLGKGWKQEKIAKEVGVSQPYVAAVKANTAGKRKYYIRKYLAKKNGIEWNLDVNTLEFPEYCPYLGIKIDYESLEGKGCKDNYPSLDRINPKLGYVQGNVIICSNRANRIKQDSTVEELELILNKLKELTNTK